MLASLAFWTCSVPIFFSIKFYSLLKDFFAEQGLRLTLWVDDWLHMVEKSLAQSQQELILDTFEDLGWKVNFKKSCLHFSQSAVFVGCQVWRNFNGVPWVRTLPEKARKLRTLIRRILRDGVVCARRLALVTGQCIAMIWAFTPGQLQL